MKKLTCPACGTEFIPQIADHYVAVTDKGHHRQYLADS